MGFLADVFGEMGVRHGKLSFIADVVPMTIKWLVATRYSHRPQNRKSVYKKKKKKK